MGLYNGVPCAKCGKPFEENDDVVVCPECGAPHHRACYMEDGLCARRDRHSEGDWKNPVAPQGGNRVKVCPSCGRHNPEDGGFCQYCGNKLENTTTEQVAQRPAPSPQQESYGREQYNRTTEQGGSELLTPVGPVTPEEEFDGVTAREIVAYVGPNSRYFITAFKVMKESGKKFSFNWPSLFFGHCYLFFRKMYRPALLLLAVLAVLSIPRLFYSNEFAKYYISTYFNYPIPYDEVLLASLTTVARVVNFIQLGLLMGVAVFSNNIYYKHVIKEIKRIRTHLPEGMDKRSYYAVLEQNGRPSGAMGYGSAALTALAIFGISYMIASSIIL